MTTERNDRTAFFSKILILMLMICSMSLVLAEKTSAKDCEEDHACLYGTAGTTSSGDLIPPTILIHPEGGTATLNDNYMLITKAKSNDGNPLEYQWYSNSVSEYATIYGIYDESDESYGTGTSITVLPNEGTTYYCVMVRSYVIKDGERVYSDPVYSDLVAVTLTQPGVGHPAVITSPESATAKMGESVKLSTFIKPIGEGDLNIQWYMSTKSDMSGSVAIAGANGVEYVPTPQEGTVYYRAAAYMEYKGDKSDIVYTKTAAVTFEEEKVTIEGIEVLTKPKKLEYTKGDKLNTAGMVLRVVASDGYRNATSGFTCSPTTLDKVGTQKITVTFEGKTTSFNVKVKDVENTDLVPTGIEINELPKKTEYIKGETFEPEGLVIKILLAEGGWLPGNNFDDMTFSPTKLDKVGTQTIVVTYQGKTTSFDVTVKDEAGTGEDETGKDETGKDETGKDEIGENETGKDETDEQPESNQKVTKSKDSEKSSSSILWWIIAVLVVIAGGLTAGIIIIVKKK